MRSVVRSRVLLASTFALLPLLSMWQKPVQAQSSLNNGQFCYAIADNNPPGVGGGGGRNNQDTLARIDDFNAGAATAVANITRPDDSEVGDIEALTSRPNFGELIAANGNELGTVDPTTGVFTSIGTLTGFNDFDAIVIDRSVADQSRLLGVSKDNNDAENNVIVEVFLQIDGTTGAATGISSFQGISQIADDQFPVNTAGIDGIAISPANGLVYGVANRGPRSAQRFVIIDIANGTLQDRGPFLAPNGDEIPDVEDLSFDLFDGQLFATTGSSFEAFTENAFLFSDPLGGTLAPALGNFNLETPTGAIDFEASACLLAEQIVEPGDLLLVKRITAVTQVGGEEQRFESFQNQQGTEVDDQLSAATNQAFPLGVVEAPQPLAAGDQVEYTVYVYNGTATAINNIELCDPLSRPSVLQSDSIEFAPPNGALTLAFDDITDADRSPQAPADASCELSLDGDQFLAGPPGPVGPQGTGGGVVTDPFNLAPNEIAAVRFVVEVGALQGDEEVEDFQE